MKVSPKIILDWPVLQKQVELARQAGKKIAFTNGCFDLIHYGHVRYLQAAKKTKRILVVGLNSDASVRRNKGQERPIVKQMQRAEVLAALQCVDWVTLFAEDTPQRLVEVLQPDVLVKGADWRGKPVAGSDVVRARKGRVEFIRYVPGSSTTLLIKKILKTCRD
ncbi:MAG: D-glycero-beta-D-manno-heptose 1-phosphate adenylyltransferase [Candidatus Omnitrophica bacterium]|nr:D-glycero-beta-D-manno-heptose 1-phosphate adenylyltransferase [Candidatus Omnitrophota bacterium]